jgi:putative endonuclease
MRPFAHLHRTCGAPQVQVSLRVTFGTILVGGKTRPLFRDSGSLGGGTKDRVNQYYVYIMTNHSGTLYVGVTNDLHCRVWQHKQKLIEGFTKRYNITRLAYYEETSDVKAAIAREKQIKGWVRRKKIALIESQNPGWKDLSDDWYG